MYSFPGDKLTLDDIKALEQHQSAAPDSLELDGLSSNVLPSSDLDNSKGSKIAYYPVAGPVINSKADIELAGNGIHSGSNPSLQVNSTGAELHSVPKETLTPEEINLMDEVFQDEATLRPEEDPVVKVVVNKSNRKTPVACQVPDTNPQALEFRACHPKSNALQGPELVDNLTKAAPQPDDSNRKRNVGQLRGGAASDPQKEAQRRYSARHRQKAQEARAQLELDVKQAMDEVEALKLEQEALHSQNTALQNMVDYKDSLISSVVALVKSETGLRTAHRAAFIVVTNSLIECGQASSHADRARCERKLGFILGLRHRKVRVMWKKDPLRVAKLMHAPPVDQDVLVNLVEAKASYLTNEDLMTAAALTEEQKIALTEHWNEYLNKHEDSRNHLEISAIKLNKSIAAAKNYGFDMVGNLAQSTHGFLSAAETVAVLERFTNGELIARAKLILGAWDVLRPLQHVVLLFDTLPGIDIVAIYKSLLRLDTGSGGGGEYSLEIAKKQHLL